MADLNFCGIHKANPCAATKIMLQVNAQRYQSRGHLFDKTLIARQLGELLPSVDTNMVEVEMFKVAVVVWVKSDDNGHNFA